ncbi:sulfatase-like hydrolase/transferase [uncultured Megasphaera sp.]|uniref:phosphoethanolamine transferase n=1 Tax=uncultured Megasphaera sp. TaxID=165188 RepID=UPI0026149B01|nr:sulfatase-like hydrolase/transferase [uncultured Megasphaera sp.]
MHCAISTILWIAIYTAVFSRIPDALHKDIGNYYIVPCLFFALQLICIIGISRLRKCWRVLCSLVYSTGIFLLFICAIFYASYALIYGQPFDEYALLSVIATNPDEIINYLTATFSLAKLLLIGILIVTLFAAILWSTFHTTSQPYPGQMKKKKVIVFAIVIVYFFINYLMTIFPADQVLHLRRLNGPMNTFIQLKNNLDTHTDSLTIQTENKTLAEKLPGTVIVVIGESAVRDRMSAFNDSYPTDTTPWEKAQKASPDFIFFDKAYANFPNTVMAVTQALTSSNQYNKVPLKDAIDIIDVAKKGGYHTYWLSLQNKSTVSDAGVTVLADRADTVKWLHGQDETVIQELQRISTEDDTVNNFIIVHLNGSHFRYDRRVPESFIQSRHLPTSSKEDYYDDSLQYTDYVLQQIYEYGKKHMQLQAMVYVSDHGENMEYTHTSSPFRFDMVHIPLWLYLSPEYAQAYPDTIRTLRNHSHDIFTNDLLFESLSGIIQAPSNFYHAEYDLSSPDYSLTLDQALTLHGKKHIREDI